MFKKCWEQGSRYLVLSSILIIFIQSIQFFHPILLSKIIDLFADLSSLIQWMSIYIVSSVVLMILFPVKEYLLSRVLERVREFISVYWNERIFSKDSNEIHKHHTHEVVEIFDRAIGQTDYMAKRVLDFYLPNLIQLLVISAYIWAMGMAPFLVLLCLVSMLVFGISWLFVKKIRPLINEVNELDHRSQAYVADILECGPTIKISGTKSTALRGFQALFHKFYKKQTDVAFWEFLSYGIAQGIIWITQAAILVMGIVVLQKDVGVNELTVGSVISLFLYASFFVHTVLELAYVFYDGEFYASDKSFLDALLRVSQREKESTKSLNTARKSNIKIAPFSLVWDSNRGLSCSEEMWIEAGSKVAVFGEQGKSLLAEIISGVHRTSGVVFCGESDVGLWSWEELQQVFYISEAETRFLSGNFSEAVMYGIEYNLDHGEKILCMLHLNDFVVYLRDLKREFPVSQLSSGEKKRFGLFRAMMLKRPVTILDSPTEAIDKDLVKEIEKILFKYFEEQTLICCVYEEDCKDRFDHFISIEGHRLLGRKKEQTGKQKRRNL